MAKRCPTGKRRHRSKLNALIFQMHRGYMRAYLCPKCGSWHLTRPKRMRREAAG